MGVVIRCAAAYTGCPQGAEVDISNKSSTKKTLSEYVDEVKSKNLVDVNDYSVGFFER
jgi:hypothetical protein